MKTTLLVLLIVLVQLYEALNCYSCSGTTGCNDPFNSLGSGVSTTGTNTANTYCIKINYIGTIYRSGGTTCTNYWYSSNAYQTCCQSDFCNRTTEIKLNFNLIIILSFYVLILFLN
ncbi:unnamed protein product [Rotaria socialis]|uniref:Uncharacterized protein n=1 Tax=Rotaria socialis TaxID=392032 RepID=A0A817V900_9BILA|nr:unnamed protein product [Rotaria socialis]CAF3339285.1 unnamed protein product [Rotaria socialis]CAF3370953.1 unnamed protein product [Rotaria socialis]CAF3498728.1 unnamed protein product [Rotaria socialis]CAF3674811.1 unnamed protein product [Rotaria socialis]